MQERIARKTTFFGKGAGRMRRAVGYVLLLLLLGWCGGFLNGLLGAGGGILLVYGLRLLLRRKGEEREVYVTALAVMMPLSALSVWRYAQSGALSLQLLGVILLPAVAGGLFGAWLLPKISTRVLGRLFSAVVLLSGILMVV
jgi:uncharacterized membrane protein YfcA